MRPNRPNRSEWGARDYSSPTSCMVDGSTMYIEGTLNSNHLGSFCGCIDELSHSSFDMITIDFTRCCYLSSLFIGHLVDGVLKIKEDGKRVRVLVSPVIGRFLKMAQIHYLFDFTESEPMRPAVGSGMMPATTL